MSGEREAPLVVVADEDGTWRVVEAVIGAHCPLRRLHCPPALETLFKVRRPIGWTRAPLPPESGPGNARRDSGRVGGGGDKSCHGGGQVHALLTLGNTK